MVRSTQRSLAAAAAAAELGPPGGSGGRVRRTAGDSAGRRATAAGSRRRGLAAADMPAHPEKRLRLSAAFRAAKPTPAAMQRSGKGGRGKADAIALDEAADTPAERRSTRGRPQEQTAVAAEKEDERDERDFSEAESGSESEGEGEGEGRGAKKSEAGAAQSHCQPQPPPAPPADEPDEAAPLWQRMVARLTPSADPRVLLGREREQQAIEDYLTRHVEDAEPGSLYVSGKPGTGKTATVSAILQRLQSKHNIKVAKVNCMSASDPRQVFPLILDGLAPKRANALSMSAGEAIVCLEKKYLVGASRAMHVILLDEIDHLQTRGNDELYKIFSWPRMDDAKVIVIGIANALDLTERILPLLRAHGLSPKAINFRPYARDQLQAIMHERVREFPTDEAAHFLPPRAIDLCASKVAASSGDLRACLDLCRRTIELKAKITGGKPNPSNPMGILLSLFKEVVSTDHVARLKSLPLHQRLVLCTFHRLEKIHGAGTSRKLCQINDTYRKLCQEARLDPCVDDVSPILNLLACSGFVGVQGRGKDAQVHLKMACAEIERGLGSQAFFADMLARTSPAPQN